MEEQQYVQNDDGSRSYTFTLTQEQLNADNFLNQMKTGADLLTSWSNQKKMIGQKNLPSADSPEEDWQRVYEKARPSDYELDDENLKKFASDNGLNKYQAKRLAEYITKATTVPPEAKDEKELAKLISSQWGEKTNEKIQLFNAVMEKAWSKEQNEAFDNMTNAEKMAQLKIMDSLLSAFGVKGADFQIGKGGTAPAQKQRDWEGYEKEKAERIKNGIFTDKDDRALRQKHNIGYIDIQSIIQ